MVRNRSDNYAAQYLRKRATPSDVDECDALDDHNAEVLLAGGESDGPPGQSTPQAEYNDGDGERVTSLLRALAPPLTLSSKLERWLTGNGREIATIEGNVVSAGEGVKRLWVTSAFNSEGKTTAALNAAYGLAHSGAKRVLLVDGNPGNAAIANVFAAPSGPGLREVLAGEVAVEAALHPTKHNGLDVITAGGGWAALGYSLPTTAMREFLAITSGSYDYIVVDGSSTYESSDITQVGALCDGAILVAACEHTKLEVVQSAANKIRNAGLEVLGVVLNRRRFYIPKVVYQWLAR